MGSDNGFNHCSKEIERVKSMTKKKKVIPAPVVTEKETDNGGKVVNVVIERTITGKHG